MTAATNAAFAKAFTGIVQKFGSAVVEAAPSLAPAAQTLTDFNVRLINRAAQVGTAAGTQNNNINGEILATAAIGARTNPVQAALSFLASNFKSNTPNADIWPGKYPENKKKYPQFFAPTCKLYDCWLLKMFAPGNDKELNDLIGLGMADGKSWAKENGF